jgi:6-pyruvoyltetrahydropterin/6-carboxytetrahydropterin synthase
MYYLKRHFTFAGGHRLSKHKGLCKNFHGHNYNIWVTIRAKKLNKDDMIMDFSTLKEHVNQIISPLDHSLIVNSCDLDDLEDLQNKGMRIMTLGGCDPTAEMFSEYIFVRLKHTFNRLYKNIEVYQVEVFENERSSAIYRED